MNSLSGNVEVNKVHFKKTNVTSIEILSDDEKNNGKYLKVNTKSAHTRHNRINFSSLEVNFITDGLKNHGHGNGLLY